MATSANASLATWTESQLARLTGGAAGGIDPALIDYMLSLTERDDVLAFVQARRSLQCALWACTDHPLTCG
jgi:hypothetical protein